MLIDKTTVKNRKSKYICDSCNIDLTVEDRVVIDRNKRKRYDLCKDCWKRIRWIIEKHKLKKGESNANNDNVG